MPNSLTSTGLTIQTEAELVTFFSQALQSIYGSAINLASNTPDGQWMNIIIQAALDNLDLTQSTYTSFDPDEAIGVTLDQRCAYNGVFRQAASFTTVTVNVVTNQVVTLYGLDQSAQPVYTVQDTTGRQYQLITTQTNLASGTNALLFQSSTPGQVIPGVSTITTMVTTVLGVVSVTNPNSYASLGQNEESDVALRIRRQRSVSLPSQGFYSGLVAALENIPGITSVNVYENDTVGVDINNVPGHSIWVIVSGVPTNAAAQTFSSSTTYVYGQIVNYSGVNYISITNNNLNHTPPNTAYWSVYNPIAQTIYIYRNAGCGMFGSQSYNVTQIDGSSFTILWDVVSTQTYYMQLTLASINHVNAPNLSQIIAYLTNNYLPSVNQTLTSNQIVPLVAIEDSNALVVSAGFNQSSSTGPFYQTLGAAPNLQYVTQSSRLILLPMMITAINAAFTFNSTPGANYGELTNSSLGVTSGGTQVALSGYGGFSTYTWGISGGGSLSSTSGTSVTYTSGVVGTDTITLTDSLSYSTTMIISVI